MSNVVLGLQFSPRLRGNSSILLDEFLKGVERAGKITQLVNASELNMTGCAACGACESTGECIINDDMQGLYPLLESARWIVVATPIFFYGPPAQGKAIIDRSQALWSRRYVKGNADRLRPGCRGFLLAVGATKGEDLFTPTMLTIKYFFDALGLPQTFNSLTYRRVDQSGAIREHPQALKETYEAGLKFGQLQ